MITPTEAWAVARIVKRLPLEPDRVNLGDRIFHLCSHLMQVNLNERMNTVRQALSADDVKAVMEANPDGDPPVSDEEIVTNRWKIVHVDWLRNLPKAQWLVEPYILENGLTVLYGASGTFKSFSALDYALQVAQHQTAIYVVYEGLLGYRQRVAAWCEHNRGSAGRLYMCIGTLAVMETAELGKFIEAARPFNPRLVVLDTVARAMTGSDENSSRDMGVFIEACSQLTKELNCALLVVHHTNKGGVYERGSNALRGAADIMIRQTVEDDIIIQECVKSKDYDPFETKHKQPLPVQVKIDGETLSIPVLVDSSKVLSDGEILTRQQLKVLETLAMEVFANGATSGELNEAMPDIPRGSLIRTLSRLLKIGLISQPYKRDPYCITEQGLNRLSPVNQMSHIYISQEKEEIQPNQTPQANQQNLGDGETPKQMRFMPEPENHHYKRHI